MSCPSTQTSLGVPTPPGFVWELLRWAECSLCGLEKTVQLKHERWSSRRRLPPHTRNSPSCSSIRSSSSSLLWVATESIPEVVRSLSKHVEFAVHASCISLAGSWSYFSNPPFLSLLKVLQLLFTSVLLSWSALGLAKSRWPTSSNLDALWIVCTWSVVSWHPKMED